jgi:hypothetical protein
MENKLREYKAVTCFVKKNVDSFLVQNFKICICDPFGLSYVASNYWQRRTAVDDGQCRNLKIKKKVKLVSCCIKCYLAFSALFLLNSLSRSQVLQRSTLLIWSYLKKVEPDLSGIFNFYFKLLWLIFCSFYSGGQFEYGLI